MPSEFEFQRGRLGLWVVAGVLFAVLSYVTWRYVGTVVLGLFGYYVTRPVLDRINSRVPNRTLAVAVALVTVTLPVLVLVAWTVTLAVQELAALAESAAFDQASDVLEPYLDLPQIRRQVEEVVQIVLSDPGRLASLDFSPVGGLLEALVDSLALVVTVGLHLFIVLVITFYLLRDDGRIAAWARGTFVDEDGVLDEYFVAVDRDLKNVYFGNILNALFTGLLGATVYSLVNLVAPAGVLIPEPVLLGLLTGVASLVPVIGMKLVWVPVALVVGADSLATNPETLWFPILFALVSVVVVDYIPDQLLRPYVSGRTLHVGAVMLAYIFGPLLFGWYGIFLGPLVLVVVFEFANVVFPWLIDPEEWANKREKAESEAEPASEPDAESAPDGEGESDEAPPVAEREESDSLPAESSESDAPERPPSEDGTDA
ncbi:AI-2E family transporter [Halorussus halophilus]|uniref:AI-2E family transporter n=1 Tax=Halorussus halophilus TaxID=2650975 RepID=UPI0013017EF7|nr:AI-2E family transporter [Halorussus halophilus]